MDVRDLGTGGQVTQERRIELVAPCPSCLHRQVCGLKEKLERAQEADVTMARLPDELHLVIQARVECAFYAKDKGLGKRTEPAGESKPKRQWSPEAREAAAERMRARRAGEQAVPA